MCMKDTEHTSWLDHIVVHWGGQMQSDREVRSRINWWPDCRCPGITMVKIEFWWRKVLFIPGVLFSINNVQADLGKRFLTISMDEEVKSWSILGKRLEFYLSFNKHCYWTLHSLGCAPMGIEHMTPVITDEHINRFLSVFRFLFVRLLTCFQMLESVHYCTIL